MRAGEQFCPGVLRAVPAKDGLLIRIRVPGGFIEANQLKTIADLSRSFADGTIEITSRANLQLRGIRERDLKQIVESISLAGLLPSAVHDRVRNLVTSPIAGVDCDELVDPRPFLYDLDRCLQADAAFAELHPKFSFAVYGGAKRFTSAQDDISLEAVTLDSQSYFHLSIGGVSSGFVVPQADAVGCMLSVAKMFIELASEYHTPVRAKAVLKIQDALERIVSALSHLLIPSSVSPPPQRISESLLGVYPTTQDDRVNIVPSVPLGRLNPEQAHCLADSSMQWKGDLRLAPWRGVIMCSIPKQKADDVVGRLRFVDLHCDGSDGFQGVAACAGETGCEASLADVRGDAALLAHRLSRHPAPSGWTVNLSGCEKQCGRRHGATVELVAGQSGYMLTAEGRHVASDCSREFVLDEVAKLHKNLLSEVAIR